MENLVIVERTGKNSKKFMNLSENERRKIMKIIDFPLSMNMLKQ